MYKRQQLFLSLALGDRERAARAAVRLELRPELRPEARDRSFQESLERLGARVDACRGGLPFRPPLATAGLLWDLARGELSPAKEVCLALLSSPA